jgi:hypothetical protein
MALATGVWVAGTVRAAQVTHVVQMSLDGLGAKYLQAYVSNAPAQFPNFVRLVKEGACTFNARCDYDISETVPNHASMLTARPVMQPNGTAATTHHGYSNNFPGATDTFHNAGNANVPYKFSVFDMTHDYGLSTALYTGKTRLAICERSYDAANGALDLVGADNGRDKIDAAAVADVSGAAISNEVNTLLQDLTGATPKRYSFIHIAEPDLTGHSANWGSASWSNMVRTVDAQLGRILNAIDTSAVLSNQTALIITADHGGGGVTRNAHTESYHITNYTIPFFVRAPGIQGGSDLYALLGNRGNPGTNRTDYTTQPQPIRDGDACNLALLLLGLPPITGSFMSPTLASSTVALSVARHEDRVGFFWVDATGQYQLEAADALASPMQWQAVSNGVQTTESTRIYTVTNLTEFSRQFYRLRKP